MTHDGIRSGGGREMEGNVGVVPPLYLGIYQTCRKYDRMIAMDIATSFNMNCHITGFQ